MFDFVITIVIEIELIIVLFILMAEQNEMIEE
jgi:hypothetical protein